MPLICKKEAEIRRDTSDGIKADVQNVTLNDIYELCKHLKRGLKDNTFQITVICMNSLYQKI